MRDRESLRVVLCALALLAVGCRRVVTLPPSATAAPVLPSETVTSESASPEPSPTITSAPAAFPTPDLQRPRDGIPLHTLDVLLNSQDRTMQVAHTVLLQNRSSTPWSEVVLSVPPAHAAGVFQLKTVEMTTLRQRRMVTTSLESTMLHVHLPDPLLPGEPIQLHMEYALRIPPVTPITWLPEGNLGAGSQVIQAGDWHAALVPYSDETGWHTWEYYSVGDPTVYDVADFDVRISSDPGLVIAAPGEIARSGSERRYRLDNARAFAFTASSAYRVIETSVDGIPVLSYYLPPFAEAAQSVLDTASLAIPLFSSLYGPYPVAGLVIAQNAYYGSMEYTGFISMSDFAYRNYLDTPTTLLVNLTAHEIAHQWWYGAVGNDQVLEPWLDESFAKYSEVLFYERYYPEAVPWWWENHIDRYNPGGPLDVPIYAFDNTADYIHQVYSQGARFMGDLRALMGDEQFFAFVRAYQASGQLRLVAREDFFAVLNAHTGKDLAPLLNRYFSGE